MTPEQITEALKLLHAIDWSLFLIFWTLVVLLLKPTR